jgi:hypothetical protein
MTTPAGPVTGRRRVARGPALAIGCAALMLTACASGSAQVRDTATGVHAKFDPANFVDPTLSTNRWQPLHPGMQWVREGTTLVGSRPVPHQVVTTMTDVIRRIDGVPTIASLDQDTDAGQVVEVSIDYFGLDKDGNVWLLGGYTADYSSGKYTYTADSWLGTQNDGQVGILMPKDPVKKMPRWFIGQPPDGTGSAAEVVQTGAHQCVDFACYDNVLITREGEIGAIDNAFKYYAPDIGFIRDSPRRDSQHKDVEQLVNLTTLSAAGLTDMSNLVLQLESLARTAKPDVFGTAISTRAP